MKIERILPFARTLLTSAVNEGDTVIDATVGNGHDTSFLAKLVGASGHVYGFDIQDEAIQNTSERLAKQGIEQQVTLIKDSHSRLKNHIPTHLHGNLTGAIFNLGYLPGGNKKIVTLSTSTIQAIEQLIELLAPEGIIVLVIYHGHEQGQIERDDVLHYVSNLDQQIVHVLRYQFINQQNNPPFIVAIEKR
ncbi:class I SAM-dependent methyltransferase [Priestia flexa]|jgi:predicted methyltransferase|uniref:Class I SAM-dependent methyltransferase n=1 Tax=Priestia flexa TaxID=86664 RepID=A0A1N6YYJ4_9BACI|nr:class I SAM-dependent methyltransferase [Priestia flexa]AQX53438.1 16S rRNA (cytosine(1402)-N(4))-methyltransferase [Priestia flexa]MBN8250754.1 methyltransferase domain-containing protein [Priestia flexa]MBN8436002.1 methyltransferase domain-containing protein [Priestia flexa]MBY6088284.1 methyltransferase domain-containing protein [Priestia flexa]MCA0968549.1 methyltransferase domain-containing protein [Priestia flexa]